MPPKSAAPGTPEEWLVKAFSSLSLARQPKPPDVLWEDQCFLAHQAVEKALKAIYQHRGLLFKFTHDIGELGGGLERGGLKVPPEVRQAISLTKYAYETRYPGPPESVTEEEYRRSVALAGAVVAWAERIVCSTEAREAPAVYVTHRQNSNKKKVAGPPRGSDNRAGKLRRKKRGRK